MSYITEIAKAIRGEVAPSLLPSDDTDSLFNTYAVLALAKGTAVTAEDVHNAWAAWMSDRQPDHPSIQPFSALSAAVQREDLPFVAAIHAVAVRLAGHGAPQLD